VFELPGVFELRVIGSTISDFSVSRTFTTGRATSPPQARLELAWHLHRHLYRSVDRRRGV